MPIMKLGLSYQYLSRKKMNILLPGLRKFSEKIFPKQQSLFETLSEGQKPHSLMITCSDSRIDPNLVTQTNPGEIFVVRNAGNIIPPFGKSLGGEAATIELAIEALGVSNIIICGHSQCGAMSALHNPKSLDKLPTLKSWLKFAGETQKFFERKKEAYTIENLAEKNVLVQADNLKTHPSVINALKEGRVHIFAWVYHFETGSITIYDPEKKAYVRTADVKDQIEENSSKFAL